MHKGAGAEILGVLARDEQKSDRHAGKLCPGLSNRLEELYPQQGQYEHPVDPTLLMETRQSWSASVSTQQPYTKLPSHVFCLRWVGNVCL